MPTGPGQQPKRTVKRPSLYTPTKLPATKRAKYVQGQMKRAQPGVGTIDAIADRRELVDERYCFWVLDNTLNAYAPADRSCLPEDGGLVSAPGLDPQCRQGQKPVLATSDAWQLMPQVCDRFSGSFGTWYLEAAFRILQQDDRSCHRGSKSGVRPI
jgi:hypothetical protein